MGDLFLAESLTPLLRLQLLGSLRCSPLREQRDPCSPAQGYEERDTFLPVTGLSGERRHARDEVEKVPDPERVGS